MTAAAVRALVPLVAFACAPACAPPPGARAPSSVDDPRYLLAPCAPRGSDDDEDGLDDGEEDCLLARHAPVLHLPLAHDHTRPANVDWYLARTTLRFNHKDACDDCPVIERGVTQDSLVNQRHQAMSPRVAWPSCRHRDPVIASNGGPWLDKHHFFLQMLDAGDQAGAADPADWRTYGHVYPNRHGGVDVQYWFFYAYNDSVGGINHEGDWESITVRTGADRAPAGVFFCAHGDCSTYRDAGAVTWWQGSHPEVFVADGSHASYPSAAACESAVREQPGPNCDGRAESRWFTGGDSAGEAGFAGGGVINVGERGRPLGGQVFILYYSRWGEIGEASFTSGPITPSYQDDWVLD